MPYPPILICGTPNSGRRCLAKATHNSFGNLRWKEIDGKILAYGHNMEEWFKSSDVHESLFIRNAEHISPYCMNLIVRITKERKLLITHPFEVQTETLPFESRLLIMSCDLKNIESLNPILDIISVRVNLPYHLPEPDLFRVLKQRCHFLNWPVESDQLFRNIAKVSPHVGQCVNILAFTHKVAMGQTMTSYHLNKALHLLNLNSALAG
jgi:hypothetical protein